MTETEGNGEEKASDMRCDETLYCRELITVSFDGPGPINKLPLLCPLRLLSSVGLRFQHHWGVSETEQIFDTQHSIHTANVML